MPVMNAGRKRAATKIICTLGPSSSDGHTIEKMIKEGMSVARLNFSHGTQSSHGKLITLVRRAAAKLDRPVSIMQDLCGPKLRVGKLQNDSLRLKSGETLELAGGEFVGDERRLPVSMPQVIRDLKKGDRVFLADGNLRLRVRKVGSESVQAAIVTGGELHSHQGVNLPDTKLSLPSLTDKDRDDARFGLQQGVDIIALSFVRSVDDVLQLRQLIEKAGQKTPIYAKLEKPEGIKHLCKIVEATDGVIVARGDLGVEMPLEKVPIIQKEITRVAAERFKPVVIATQMLESMISSPRPTRAEASDVANTIFEGNDAVLLSGETAAGKYPVEVVRTLTSIARTVERSRKAGSEYALPAGKAKLDFSSAVAEAAVRMAEDIGARVIACFTKSGMTARLISKQGSTLPIVAFTSDRKVLTRMPILRGVSPMYMPMIRSVDQIIIKVESRLKDEKIVRTGDKIVIVASAPVAVYGQTNMLKLHEIS
jgi:pyruvate kinase